jgi:rfaE bifunctional protein kinase chain/domain
VKGAEASAILDRMAGLTIAVLGDICLDEYLVGRAERLSREAPVPVLLLTRRFRLPGGAANPARNIAALGALPRQVGLVGDPARQTTCKTRVLVEGAPAPQHVARIDDQSRTEVSGQVEAELLLALEAAASGASAILVSDYKSGVVSASARAAALRLARAEGVWLTVDSQGDLERFAGFDLVRAARPDVEASLGRPLAGEDDFRRAAVDLREQLGARAVIISRGHEGMSVAGEAGFATVAPANVSEVFDVAGAGDTVIAVLTLALSAGAPLAAAVELANAAAGIVVRRLGVAAPGPTEILAELD